MSIIILIAHVDHYLECYYLECLCWLLTWLCLDCLLWLHGSALPCARVCSKIAVYKPAGVSCFLKKITWLCEAKGMILIHRNRNTYTDVSCITHEQTLACSVTRSNQLRKALTWPNVRVRSLLYTWCTDLPNIVQGRAQLWLGQIFLAEEHFQKCIKLCVVSKELLVGEKGLTTCVLGIDWPFKEASLNNNVSFRYIWLFWHQRWQLKLLVNATHGARNQTIGARKSRDFDSLCCKSYSKLSMYVR